MNENRSPENPVTGRTGGIGQGMTWIAQGLRLVQKQKSLWYGMTAIYFVLGFLLKLIPFMGDLLLILITPMLLAGVVWGRAQDNDVDRVRTTSQAPISAAMLFQTWLLRPTQELARIFAHEVKVFGAVLLGIVTLGLVMLVKIAGYLLIGGSIVTGLSAGQLSAPQITTLLGMLVVAVLFVVLAMGLFYSAPLTVLRNRPPLAAIAESFSVCRQYPVPWLTLVAPFYIVYLLIIAVFARYHWLGDLLIISAGFATLPVFVAAAYCSYLTLYPPTDPASPK